MSSTPTLSQPPDLRAVTTIATFLLESIPMYSIEQTRLDPLYATMLCALQLQGKAEKTVEAYARAVRRSADFFERCLDNLTAEELQTYFAALLKSHSWSRVKLDRCGLPFFYRYVLKRPWDWTEIVKPPRPQRLPEVLTQLQFR